MRIFPYSHLVSFSFYSLRGNFTTHNSQGRKTWFFFFFSRPARRLYLQLNYIVGHLCGLFARTCHNFNKFAPFFSLIFLFFFFIFFIYWIAFSRVYFFFGGLDGPDKDQVLKPVDDLESLSSFPSDSSR